MLKLTPAYDICPQLRTSGEASQAMLIYGGHRMSQLRQCITAAPQFQLSRADAITIIEEIANRLVDKRKLTCEESQISIISAYEMPNIFVRIQGHHERRLFDKWNGRLTQKSNRRLF